MGTFYDAGIYAIVSLKTGQVYVGSSKFLTQRAKSHLAGIKNGNHRQKIICQTFAGHGLDDVEWRVLETATIRRRTRNSIGLDFDAITGSRILLDREYAWAHRLGAVNRTGQRIHALSMMRGDAPEIVPVATLSA
jgi:hypothetical protein